MKNFFAKRAWAQSIRGVLVILAGILLVLFFVLPLVVSAQGLVPCGIKYGSAAQKHLCTACDIFTLLQTILNTTYTYVAAPVAALMMGWGGLYMIFGGFGNPRMYESGKKILGNAVIGLAIIFISWLAVDTLLKAFQGLQYSGSSAFGPWNKITCTAPEIQGAQHMGCDQGSCVKVPGFGANTCTRNENCGPNAVHAECQNKQCQEVAGSNIDSCSPVGSECGVTKMSCAPADIAARNNDPVVPAKVAPQTYNIDSCIINKLFERKQIKSPTDVGEVSYYQKSGDFNCNYSRGNTSDTCTPTCIHAKYSCHYGGQFGKDGALAVDYGNEALCPQIIQAAKDCGVPPNKARCEGNHAHISMPSCDKN